MVRAISSRELYNQLRGRHPDGPARLEPKSERHRIRLPADREARVGVARQLADAFGKRIALLSIREWGVWPSESRLDLYRAFCAAHGLTDDLHEASSFRFAASEQEAARELFAISVESLWDTFVFSANGKRWLWVSHDEVGAASFALPADHRRA